MALKTKSIQKKRSAKDGLRICVMRRPGEFDDWDMWIPKLSPSNELLNQYVYEGLSWEDMQRKFHTQVIKKQTRLLEWLIETAQNQDVTLLCFEETADKCHRKLIAEYCKSQSNGTLKIVLK